MSISDAKLYNAPIKYDAYGNIIGVDYPEYNEINKDDSLVVAEAKQEAQMKQHKEECS